MADGLTHRFEFATRDDPALNYCLWPYPSPAEAEDKYRSINLLLHSFAQAGMTEAACQLVDAIRDEIGPFRTVFGIKQIGEITAWEFYFYDYARRARQVSISRVLHAVRPWLPSPVVANEDLPYFMFSMDLANDFGRRPATLDVIHMYVGNPGSAVSSGIAYALRANETRLENFYFFFDAASQLDQVANKVASSAVFDATHLPLDRVLVPELRQCRTICVANKQTHDCIYFSGVNIEQLSWFLEEMKYPEETKSFVLGSKAKLDHLLFDVGFDYRMEDGCLKILKSGYYGVF